MFAHSVNIKLPLVAMRLARRRGKKAGESFEREFWEVAKKHPDWIYSTQQTDKDVDQLTGEAREAGHKVLNIHEVDRQAEIKRKQNEQNS